MNAPMDAALPAPEAGPLGTAMALTERLNQLVEQEAVLLESRRPQELSSLQDEKHRLVALYGREMARLKSDPAALQAAPAAERARLKEMTGRLRDLLERHGRRITVMRSVTDGLIKAVGDEVAARNRPVSGYDRNAQMRADGAATVAAARPASVALNKVI